MLVIPELIFFKSFWIGLFIVVYLYLKLVVFSYWNRKKVPHETPNLLLGNINMNFILDKITIGELVKEQYDKFRKQRFFGVYMFHNPILVINDPEIIRSIMIKNFQHFYDRGIHSNVDVDPMSFNLFRLPGEKWKNLRTKLTPIFTSGKLKQLYPLLVEVSQELIDICNKSADKENIIDAKDIVERFITDCISNIAFGFNCNSLKDPENEFRNYGKLGTDIGKYTSVMNINRDKFNMLEAAAQVFVFFIAGFETTSTTVTYCLHELAKFPDVQEKLQQEIDEIANTPEGFSYDNVMNMKYLDMVFNETLRKHPPVPFINRLCTKDYDIPDSDLRIPKGLRLAIPVAGLQNDPDIYPDPDQFEPERFSKENCAKRNSFYFLPFGDGPRICIAKRIALMQGKIGLVTLLSKFKFSICDKTPIPLPYSNRTFLLVSKHKLYLKITKR